MNHSMSHYLREAAMSIPLPLSRAAKNKKKAHSWSDSDTDTEAITTDTNDNLAAGLGINFNNYRGERRRSVSDLSSAVWAEQKKEGGGGEGSENPDQHGHTRRRSNTEAMASTKTIFRSPSHGRGTPRSQYLQGGRGRGLPYRTPSISRSPLSRSMTTRSVSQHASATQQQQAGLPHRAPFIPKSPCPLTRSTITRSISQHSSPTSPTSPTHLEIQTPKLLTPLLDPDWDNESPLDLIDKYLEHNYREQAETFVRIASRETPIRALSASLPGSAGSRPRSRLSSRSSALAPSAASAFEGCPLLGLGIASKVDTPSPPSLVGAVSPFSEFNNETSPFDLIEIRDEHKSPILRSISKHLRLPGTQASTANLRRRASTSTSSSSGSSNPAKQAPSRVQQVCEIYNQRSASNSSSGFSPLVSVSSKPIAVADTPTNAASRLRTSGTIRVPIHTKPTIIKRNSRPTATLQRSASTPSPRKASLRGSEYFTREERHQIARLVHATARNCERHTNCKDCIDLEYAYYENKLLPSSMDREQRQKIINNNRSLRNIKNELESLAEHGAISDDVYDTIMSALPAESSLAGAARSNPTPVQAQAVAVAPAPAPAPAPTNAFNNMHLNEAPPPAYTNPSGPPSLPNRAPSAPPAKPEIARATALYRYVEPDDCTFEPGDQIAVHEYMNNDWWLGRNLRTGKEGVFPVNYVQIVPPQNPHGVYDNEKSSYSAYQAQQQNQGPPPPGPSNPYNSSVPPMAVAEEPSKPSKGGEMGKKFGKKLGNAAIFGAGATIGGNIVNSIF